LGRQRGHAAAQRFNRLLKEGRRGRQQFSVERNNFYMSGHPVNRGLRFSS